MLALLAISYLCPVAISDDAQDNADDEAAYRALRGEAAPEPEPAAAGNKTTGSTTGRRMTTTMPRLSGAGPSLLNKGKGSGPVFLVKQDEFNGEKSYSLMSAAEVKERKKQLSVEARKIRSAYRLAEKEWVKTEKCKYPFPCPRPRQAQAGKRYQDREKGEDKLSSINAGIAKENEARIKAQAAKLKNATPRQKAKVQKEIALERKKLELFVSMLAKLMAGETPTQTAVNKGAGGKAAEKKDDGAVNLL